jgi:Na+/melibiose symporter-like transporter
MVAGSLVGALVAATGLPLLAHLGFTATVVVATGVLAARTFLPMPSSRVDHRTGARGAQSAPRGSAARSALAAWREPRTLLLGLGILGAALAEGSASDWTGIALVSGFGTPESIAGAGVTLFYASMLVARLLGTTLVLRLGRVTTLRLGAGGVLVGLALFVFSPWLPLAMAGSVIWGMGAALGFPVGLSAASDDPQRAAMRVSVVSTIGYTAYVIGPGVIGVVAGHLGYRGALLVVAAPVVLAMVAARAARPLPTTARHRPGTDAERDDADAREPVLVGTA